MRVLELATLDSEGTMASAALDLDTELARARPTPLWELPLPSRGPVGVNRRFTPRLNARFLVRPSEGGPSYEGVDISFGGMMCVGGEPMWPGNQLRAELILPGEHKSLLVSGRVVELVSFRGQVAMRVRFEGLAQATRKRIVQWMARRASV